ncbi:MAG: peptide deformylase [Devosia nanyangense]|uniref:Peptide deformylase-like n=1 Tax=Devosia nanyangense TaxID=1228055 RepID=A0A933L335_9HYPH|nr:peptide deformylase [Devosia nanyangense]
MADFVLYPDPRLNRPAVPFDTVDDRLRATGRRLLAAAQACKAHGLAAAHLGEVAPVVVIDGEAGEYRLLFNPRVIAVSDERETGEEGSVSLPGVRVMVERPLWADVAFQTEAGEAETRRLTGFAARVALHEIDQMNGVFFLERVSRLKREMALKKAKKHGG